jgi:hypothetical protein
MGYNSWNNQQWTKPFGFVMENGLNFSKSIGNPKSVIRRMLRAVDESPVLLTRAEILRRMGYELGRSSKQIWVSRVFPMVNGHYDYDAKPIKVTRRITKTRTNTRSTTRGYLSYYFSGAHKAGFLIPVRKGNTVLWVKGNNFPNPALLVNVKV